MKLNLSLFLFCLIGTFTLIFFQTSECIQINSISLSYNKTIPHDQKLVDIKEHLLKNATNNSTEINEEVLDNTIEELTDLSNEIEMKLKELKKRELIMDVDKKNIGVFASITMIALVLLFYLGVAHMEDALKDASILNGDIVSPQNVIFDPRW
ncbi:putative integral membrane protein [Cryptosporidium meleagridis]|uniref:Putative integral membrane protein n=1 Tax=Cryptosporidium meleagridis TaxID=93969 RepID=A0A2P4Z0Q5_9CRYT|nr:putative integral membrane protein [Cryptosporidium meleagridis]